MLLNSLRQPPRNRAGSSPLLSLTAPAAATTFTMASASSNLDSQPFERLYSHLIARADRALEFVRACKEQVKHRSGGKNGMVSWIGRFLDDIVASKRAANRQKDKESSPRLLSFREWLRKNK
jgi:hypothetical protein